MRPERCRRLGLERVHDDAGYGSEEILATTLFNFYRSIGGDHPDLGRRQFASRMAMYLIMRAIGDLTPATDRNTRATSRLR